MDSSAAFLVCMGLVVLGLAIDNGLTNIARALRGDGKDKP